MHPLIVLHLRMQTFLGDVALRITPALEIHPRVKIIVPTRRAILFLKEELKQTIQSTLFSPEIISIEEFVEDLSGFSLVPKTELHLLFYSLYKEQTHKDKRVSFSVFLKWSSLLISEFNEIDNQLVEPKEVFQFMSEVEKLEQWNPSVKKTETEFTFQKAIPKLYYSLKKTLSKREMGYSGMLFREATHQLEHYLASSSPHHYFVGFNALTTAESVLIQELISADKAEVLWDLDRSFFTDPHHSAGHFIRQHFKQWKGLQNEDQKQFKAYYTDPKKIEIISAVKNQSQAQLASQLAQENYKRFPNETVALVLGEETVLQAVLSGLPESEVPWNVTMGYPLKNTVVSNLFLDLLRLHTHFSAEGYLYEDLKRLSNYSIFQEIIKTCTFPFASYLKECETKNSPFISLSKVTKGEVGDLLFSPFTTAEIFIDRMISIAERCILFHSENSSSPMELYSSQQLFTVWTSCKMLFNTYTPGTSLSEVKEVFELLLAQQTLDFKGDALKGIQIMGLLETRLLDFDTVIITHVNEGILPLGKTPTPLLPFDVRKKFGLNTFIEQDHVYAYHFFRVLQRAKKIYLIYNNAAEGLFSGEKSRFLVQLEYFSPLQHELTLSTLNIKIPTLTTVPKKAEKSKEVIEQLQALSIQGFSPSSLALYIRDPYQFYEQKLLRIQPLDQFENHLNAADKGTIIHAALETLYTPFVGKILTLKDVDEMIDTLPKVLTDKLALQFGANNSLRGKNYIMAHSMRQVLNQFLNAEKKLISAGNSLRIEALEHPYTKKITHPHTGNVFLLKGTVDRIDCLNGERRIIDYKTGAVTLNDVGFSSWEEVTTDPKKSALFQVLLYAYSLHDNFNEELHSAGVIPLKNYNTTFLPLHRKESKSKKHNLSFDVETLTQFEMQLFGLLDELFDSSVPFTQKLD